MRIEKQIRNYYCGLETPAMEKVLPDSALGSQKKTQASGYWKMATLAGCLSLLLLTSILLLSGVRKPGDPHISVLPTAPTEGNPTTPTEPSVNLTNPTDPTDPTNPNSGGILLEPNELPLAVKSPHMIIEIEEITTETRQYFSWEQTYTKVRCTVLYAHYCRWYADLTEIYIPTGTEEKLKPYSKILVGDLVSVHSSFYSLEIDEKGDPVFLPFVDDALVVESPEFFGKWFGIDFINQWVEIMKDTQNVSNKDYIPVMQAFPKKEITNSATVQEVIAFFEACKEYRAQWELYRKKVGDVLDCSP